MSVVAVLASRLPVLWEGDIGADVMEPIAASVGERKVTFTIHVLCVVLVFLYL
jgi:copper/silver efflux system protein